MREIRHFHVLVVQKRQRNVEKRFYARAKLLYCLLEPFFFHVLVAVESLGLKVPINLHISTSLGAAQNEAECWKTVEAACITAN